MEHNNLTSIAYARPIIYAEGLFASCYLDEGKFVAEEGISQSDLWRILSGELLKTGSDLVEDYAVSVIPKGCVIVTRAFLGVCCAYCLWGAY